MRFELENVGKLEYVNIELNGITVIAGENNTGKSTVGKMLFCIFSTFCRIEKKIEQDRRVSISRVIASIGQESDYHLSIELRRLLSKRMVEGRESYLADPMLIEKELSKYYISDVVGDDKRKMQESLENASGKIYALLSFEDTRIMERILQKKISQEFGKNIGHVNTPKKESKISLSIKDKSIDITVSSNNEISIKKHMSLLKEIIYIDDPFVLDDLAIRIPYRNSDIMDHRGYLRRKLRGVEKTNTDISVLEELVVNEKIKKIYQAMSDVCDGELIEDETRAGYIYKTDKLADALELPNLSTGLKTFVILRTLLQNGSIEENGVVILDEPEIHLHPEWQLKFAEIIVLMQKEFGIHVLLNTHSPYFLNAIEVYSDRYKISDKCRYYLTEEKDGISKVMDVTDSLERIYEKLARPLQELENLGY